MIFLKNPQNEVYEEIINLAFDICDVFVFAVNKSYYYTVNEQGELLIEKLKDSLIEVKEQTSWPGTTSGALSLVYYYRTDLIAKKIILEATNSLHSWMHRDLPQDLSFMKKGKDWLLNIAHEELSWIDTNDEKEIERIMSIKGLEVRL